MSPEELPLTDPSRFADQPEIVLDSIESAEDQLEWDVNSGEKIQTPEGIHAKAVREYATYDLKLPAASPGSRREGDAADDGQRRLAVAKEYRSRYEDTIQMILDVDKGEDADPESYAVAFGFESY
ncbi:hypothetical protein C449_00970 [Halococcus saccharolyticus DSM 5350]|uniref:Uncharacterized protein n=1 Tax=Halococcus saccharolyticus DSM 5350 TaxID=1227455 RepID=M0MU90_9EURY|nr:hypothetical protein [Halococcus saccharolyticus]EMA48000.1 hypothetical protein C449_00970 [Halococcus saccharolyticus DSM 5350]